MKVFEDGIVESDKHVGELGRFYLRGIMYLPCDKFSEQLKFANCLNARQENSYHLWLEKLHNCIKVS